VREYTVRAITRAAGLSAQTIVFGSSGAKNVPEGFPMARAWEQIVETLRMVDLIAAKHGITIAIEPLNRRESNIVLTAREGLALARQVDRPHIKLLVDYYHMTLEDESPDILLEAGPEVRHIHFARVIGRAFPTEVETGYRAFFANLKQIGYNDRVSVEAYTTDFVGDAPKALAVLKSLCQ
jgi:sugar phosphate isomerase/epimerase